MRILLISTNAPDDELTRALEVEGHTATHTPDSQEALEMIMRGSADLAVVNLLLKHLGAVELLGLIRVNNQELPIITTGSATNGKHKDPPGLSALGIHHHITEPLTPDTLLRAIETIPIPATNGV